jgi:2-methylcitrate dehydratase PrpD
MNEGAVAADQIQSVDVFLRPLIAEKAGEPSRYYKKVPESFLDTQVSYYYLLAVTALGISPDRWQREATFKDPAVRSMIEKIHLHADAQAEDDLQQEVFTWPHRATGTLTRVVVRTNKAEWSAQTRYGDGDPFDSETRASDAQLDEKFLRFAAPLLSQHCSERVPEAIWALEAGLATRALVSAFQ